MGNLISVVVPFLNEADCLEAFCAFMDDLVVGKAYQIELVFVDDGSTDDSVNIIAGHKFYHCRDVKVVKLSKNFGAHAAVRAGITQATGDYCTFIGADLQSPDDMIDVMYDAILKGYDAVYIEKGDRHAGRVSKIASSIYAALMRRYAVKNFGSGGINDIMFSRKLINYLNEYIESNSSIHLQIINAGFKYTTIKMDYKPRVAGASKWTLSKKIKLFIDSFVSFSYMPIRVVSFIGIAMALLGLGYGAFILIHRLLNPEVAVQGFATLTVLLLLGFGVTNISLGIIAEYLWRTFDASRKRPVFIIDEVIEAESPENHKEEKNMRGSNES